VFSPKRQISLLSGGENIKHDMHSQPKWSFVMNTEEKSNDVASPQALKYSVKYTSSNYPYIPSYPLCTESGTPYLTSPGVHLISKPSTDLESLRVFLAGYGEDLHFLQYLDDENIEDGAQLCKLAGQLCYMSFAPRRTKNNEASRYFDNIKQSGHGSVLEHANFSLLFYGVSRSLTHELVRHRAGFAFSQVSQRYCSGKVVRFVERPEYSHDPELHSLFLQRIDRAAKEYDELAENLLCKQKSGSEILSAEAKTDLRKKVQQAARSVLPNETEAPIVVTANARAWRHFIEMRANQHAETEIRELAFRVYLCLNATEPILFEDYETVCLPDGTYGVDTPYRKV
jgi:thymidylate synthase (FAD)